MYCPAAALERSAEACPEMLSLKARGKADDQEAPSVEKYALTAEFGLARSTRPLTRKLITGNGPESTYTADPVASLFTRKLPTVVTPLVALARLLQFGFV